MIKSLNNTASTRVYNHIFFVVRINDCHFWALKWYAESEANIVFAKFIALLRNTITFDSQRKSRADTKCMININIYKYSYL